MLLEFYLSGNLCNFKFLRSNLHCVIDAYDMQSNLFVCLHNFVFKCLDALRLNCTLNIIRENINRSKYFFRLATITIHISHMAVLQPFYADSWQTSFHRNLSKVLKSVNHGVCTR